MFVWVGKEADDVVVIGRVVSAELLLYCPSCVCIGRVALYLPSCSVSAAFVAHIIRTVFAIINTVLLIVD